MKRGLTIILILVSLVSYTQVLIQPQLPPGAILQKPQLWNMLLSNGSSAVLTVHIEMMMTDLVTGQQVMSGVSKVFSLNPGSDQRSVTTLGPIQYNVLGGGYVVDPGPNGFLPFGNFQICYSVLRHNSDAVEKIAEECEPLEVSPLSPPLLVFPYDRSAIETTMPQFNWLPPSPITYFSNLRYDLEVVEIMPGQSAVDAIQQNLPLLQMSDLAANNYHYSSSAMPLSYNREYAWRVSAKTNGSVVSRSETWVFTPKKFQKLDTAKLTRQPYAKLSREIGGDFHLAIGRLKFEYLNESGDTTWNINLSDLSSTSSQKVAINLDSIPLRRGQNLVDLPLDNQSGFVPGHLYSLELKNSRSETWHLLFEYRKEN